MSFASRAMNRLRELYGKVLRDNRLREAERFGYPSSCLRPEFEGLEPRLLLSTTYTVDSLADVVAADLTITLREAIEAANTNAIVGDAPAGDPVDADIIQFDPSLTGGTITLGGVQLSITDDLEIHGLGADLLTVDGDDLSRVFDVVGATVLIDDLEITGGNADFGGGIRNTGVLSLSSIVLVDNDATEGGGIYNTGTLTVDDSTVSDNAAATSGGGIRSSDVGSVLIVTGSLISGNSGTPGGGIYTRDGETTVTNSTVSGNTGTTLAGGIRAYSGTVHVVQSTITANHGGEGGGIDVVSATVTLENTVVAGNTANGTGQDVQGAFESAGDYNLIGIIDDSTGLDSAGTQYGTTAAPLDAMLGPLADNGGPTLTHLPWDGSPVLDAGHNELSLDYDGIPLATDQRGTGFDRILNVTVDIGAVEGSRAVDFTLTGPVGGYFLGETIPITWDPAGVPVNSTIALYYDTDATFNGNEEWIVPAPGIVVPADGQYLWDPPLMLALGDYYFGGSVITPDATAYDARLAGSVSISVGGTTYIVDSPEDIVAVDGLLTLREAVEAASTNAIAGDAPAGSAAHMDLIQFDAALSGDTIVLDGAQLDVTDDVVITGPGAENLTINGDARSRIFAVTGPARVAIGGLTLTNGDAATDGGGVYNEADLHLAGVDIIDNTAHDDGGGIFNAGSLTITDSVVSENSANGSSDPRGGGIYNEGTFRLENVEVTLNVAYDDGGGISNSSGTFEAIGLTALQNMAFDYGGGVLVTGGTVTIADSVITQNTGFHGGGGAWLGGGTLILNNVNVEDNTTVSSPGTGGGVGQSAGTASLLDCDVAGNAAAQGGGVWSSGGTLTIEGGTISDNASGSSGGGVWRQSGGMSLTDVTVSDNEAAGSGGGVYSYDAWLTITDSEISDNSLSGGDVYGGGVYFYGDNDNLTVTRSRVVGNLAIGSSRGWGGGIYAQSLAGGTYSVTYMSITECTVSGNDLSGDSEGYGGGLYIYLNAAGYQSAVYATLTGNTVSGNSVYGASVSRGGGLYWGSSSSYTRRLDLINSTVSGNRVYGSASAGGGGIFTTVGTVYLTQSTVTLNEAAYGGGVWRSAGDVLVRNTIVAGNEAEFAGTDVYVGVGCGAAPGMFWSETRSWRAMRRSSLGPTCTGHSTPTARTV